MICRGGIVVGGQGDDRSSFFKAKSSPTDPLPIDTLRHVRRPLHWISMTISVVVVSFILAMLPLRTAIAPLVESDYCYLLTAADRFYEGQGLTTTPPVAPLQLWSWQKDWTFLTQWPIGYPLLVCALRTSFGFSTIQACQWINVIACALALVGWFVFMKRAVPDGIAGMLLSAVAAGCSVSTASLINLSTDIIVTAVLPWLLLWITTTIPVDDMDHDGPSKNMTLRLAGVGFASGTLFWIRYAGIFIPLAIGAYLLFVMYKHRAIRFREWFSYAGFAAVPVATLLILNKIFGSTGSLQSQLNLGTATNLNLSPSLLTTTWWNFTQFGFYDYHHFSDGFYALYPVVMISAFLLIRPLRRSFHTYMKTPAYGITIFLVAGLFVLLITTTAVFGDKYNYVREERYYLSVKPLYFLLFVSPLMLIPRRFIRVTLCVILLIGCHWLIRVEWPRPYQRWFAADRPVTAYGQWSRCFEPDADGIYAWLKQRAKSDWIVVSNFHEYIALETKIPALPIPPDAPTLDQWIERICTSRGVTDPHVVFVLDPDNRWRNYWIPDPGEILLTFDLKDRIFLTENSTTLILSYPYHDTTHSRSNSIALK